MDEGTGFVYDKGGSPADEADGFVHGKDA